MFELFDRVGVQHVCFQGPSGSRLRPAGGLERLRNQHVDSFPKRNSTNLRATQHHLHTNSSKHAVFLPQFLICYCSVRAYSDVSRSPTLTYRNLSKGPRSATEDVQEVFGPPHCPLTCSKGPVLKLRPSPTHLQPYFF